MRRNADLMYDLGDGRLKICITRAGRGEQLLLRRACAYLTYAVEQQADVAGLGHKVCRSQGAALANDLTAVKMRDDDCLGSRTCLRQMPQHLDAVQLQQNQIHDQDIRPLLGGKRERIDSVVRAADTFHVVLQRQNIGQQTSKVLVDVCYQNSCFGFHNYSPPANYMNSTVLTF